MVASIASLKVAFEVKTLVPEKILLHLIESLPLNDWQMNAGIERVEYC
jgi:hypothetical protein